MVISFAHWVTFVFLICWSCRVVAASFNESSNADDLSNTSSDAGRLGNLPPEVLGESSSSKSTHVTTSKHYDPAHDRIVIHTGGYWNSGDPLSFSFDGHKVTDIFANGLGYWQTVLSKKQSIEEAGGRFWGKEPWEDLADSDFYRSYVEQRDFSKWHFRVAGNSVRLGPWLPVIAQAKLKPGTVPKLPWEVLRKIEPMAQWEFDVFYIISPAYLALTVSGVVNAATGNHRAWLDFKNFAHSLNLWGGETNPGRVTTRLHSEFKTLLNNATLNGDGTQHELGYYRERLLLSETSPLRPPDRIVSPELRNLTYGETEALLGYMKDTQDVYMNMVNRIQEFFETAKKSLDEANTQNIYTIVISGLRALARPGKDKAGFNVAFYRYCVSKHDWAISWLQQRLHDMKGPDPSHKDPTWVGKLQTAKVTRFPAHLPKPTSTPTLRSA